MIELCSVTIEVGNRTLHELNLRVESGSYAVLMGRTGIGKTTLLEAICGLRKIVEGSVRCGGVDMTNWPIEDRGIGYVPQDLALFPSMTVRDHLAFALRQRRWSKSAINARVEELASGLEIKPLLDRRPKGLSGGEARRVALGRAVSFRPTVILLDEPLVGLDSATQATTQQLIQRIARDSSAAVLHVTHNESEASALANQRFRMVDDDESNRVRLQSLA